MIPKRSGSLALGGCLVVLVGACADAESGSAGGTSGTGGAAGAPVESAQLPGLWEGEAQGVEVCFYVRPDGLGLVASAECDLGATAQIAPGSHSFDLSAELIGTDENGDRCSFTISYAGKVPIDPATGVFRVVDAPADGGASLSFSADIVGDYASGTARSDMGGSFCQVAWDASTSSPCDEAAIQACLDLQDCCEAILVNPVFFQTCNSVVLQCDQRRCEEVLAGYPECASDSSPAP